MKTIFHLQNRGMYWIYHWFAYMVAGLRHINKDTSRKVVDNDPAGFYEQNAADFKCDPHDRGPHFVTIRESPQTNILQFHKETLDIISDVYVYVDPVNVDREDVVVNNYGEQLRSVDGNTSPESIAFMRELFLSRLKFDNSPHSHRKYFLRRNNSPNLRGNDGIRRRCIENEDELMLVASEFGYEPLTLENYSVREKIEIFNQADGIIGAHTGGFVFSAFSGPSQKISEINVSSPRQHHTHYAHICNVVGADHAKVRGTAIDAYDNMIVDINDMKSFLSTR